MNRATPDGSGRGFIPRSLSFMRQKSVGQRYRTEFLRALQRNVAGLLYRNRYPWQRYKNFVVTRMMGGFIQQYWRGPYYSDGRRFDSNVDRAYIFGGEQAAHSAIIGCSLECFASNLNVAQIR